MLPFTWYFFLFAACTWMSILWLRLLGVQQSAANRSAMRLLLEAAVWMGVAILVVSLLSVLVPWLYLRVQKKNKRLEIKATLPSGNENKEGERLFLRIYPLLRPLLGFIRIRLLYDQHLPSPKFSLLPASDSHPARKKEKAGFLNWQLPEIKPYPVDGIVIYLEDFFQFFSFPVTVPDNFIFIRQPKLRAIDTPEVFPRKSEEMDILTDSKQKTEGDLFHYKHFEANDDVRRIVWKVYAKSRELVVRTPEVLDHYASQVCVYASFYSAFRVDGNEVVEKTFLNFYKTAIWSAYEKLKDQGLNVVFRSDQGDAVLMDDAQLIRRQISYNDWQYDTAPEDFIRPADVSLVIVSSLTDAAALARMVQNYSQAVHFLFVPLTESLQGPHRLDWLKWIFTQPEKYADSYYRRKWQWSPLRKKIQENETRIRQVLETLPVYSPE